MVVIAAILALNEYAFAPKLITNSSDKVLKWTFRLITLNVAPMTILNIHPLSLLIEDLIRHLLSVKVKISHQLFHIFHRLFRLDQIIQVLSCAFVEELAANNL